MAAILSLWDENFARIMTIELLRHVQNYDLIGYFFQYDWYDLLKIWMMDP